VNAPADFFTFEPDLSEAVTVTLTPTGDLPMLRDTRAYPRASVFA
jgi:hypothetical protein